MSWRPSPHQNDSGTGLSIITPVESIHHQKTQLPQLSPPPPPPASSASRVSSPADDEEEHYDFDLSAPGPKCLGGGPSTVMSEQSRIKAFRELNASWTTRTTSMIPEEAVKNFPAGPTEGGYRTFPPVPKKTEKEEEVQVKKGSWLEKKFSRRYPLPPGASEI